MVHPTLFTSPIVWTNENTRHAYIYCNQCITKRADFAFCIRQPLVILSHVWSCYFIYKNGKEPECMYQLIISLHFQSIATNNTINNSSYNWHETFKHTCSWFRVTNFFLKVYSDQHRHIWGQRKNSANNTEMGHDYLLSVMKVKIWCDCHKIKQCDTFLYLFHSQICFSPCWA